MSFSTNINDLPYNPVNGQPSDTQTQQPPLQNVVVSDDKPNTYNPDLYPSQQKQNPQTIDPNVINQIINGLHEASLSGGGRIQQRDIPMTTFSHVNDKQVHVATIPDTDKVQYIPNQDRIPDIVQNKIQRENVLSNLDYYYTEFQLPIIVGILFFIFQLPNVKQILYKYTPTICHHNGNLNAKGYLFNSVVLAGLYYGLEKIVRVVDTL